ncbi:nicotinate (nicotinamide) nucleotide adenylyltransferase [Acidithiobacillus sp. GGI-221]|nr:nicotinate (nicotinamide) nucleotide adenylyltransferase [Acidithiobacillus sp. GGI-221]
MHSSTHDDLVILGGTFDPIHYGHLRAVEEVRQALAIAQAMLIPAGHPPHRKSPWADAHHRLAMTRIAVAHHPQFTVSSWEVEREGPSYTVDTLTALRQQRPDAVLAMVIGMPFCASTPGTTGSTFWTSPTSSLPGARAGLPPNYRKPCARPSISAVAKMSTPCARRPPAVSCFIRSPPWKSPPAISAACSPVIRARAFCYRTRYWIILMPKGSIRAHSPTQRIITLGDSRNPSRPGHLRSG